MSDARYRIILLLRALGLTFLMPLSAWAYIDPGTGLIVWQGLIALIGGILLVVRQPLRSLKRLFRYLARLISGGK